MISFRYVRAIFHNSLPCERTLRRWLANFDAKPGKAMKNVVYLKTVFYLSEDHEMCIMTLIYFIMVFILGFCGQIFQFLKAKVNETEQQIFVNLVFDEMSIHKHLYFNGTSYIGHVDMGGGTNEEKDDYATDALVPLIVATNLHFKMPLGYFLITKINGATKANLVEVCIQKLNDIGIKVIGITCDGLAANLVMFKHLGCTVQPDGPIQTLIQTESQSEPIYAILDVIHMIKLVRNSWGTLGVIKNIRGEEINWSYIKELNNLQNSEKLHLVNKIKNEHVNWHQQKMKSKLALQVFSNSTAESIDYAREVLKLPAFKGSEATTEFLKLMNNTIDILNSKSKFGYVLKGPLTKKTKESWSTILDNAKQYLSTVSDASERPLILSRKKTGFLGLVVSINSFKDMFENYVETNLLDYILTYKFSQDHIETFFSCVRGSLGFNSNPTAQQFQSSFKKIVIGSCNKSYSVNSITCLDDTVCLDIFTNNKQCQIYVETKFELQDLQDELTVLQENEELTEYQEKVVEYIAGAVKKKIQNKCKSCYENNNYSYSLIEFKTRGKLTIPDENSVRICKLCERILRENMSSLKRKNILHYLCNKVLSSVFTQFPEIFRGKYITISTLKFRVADPDPDPVSPSSYTKDPDLDPGLRNINNSANVINFLYL